MYTALLAQTGGGGGGNWIQIIVIIAMVGLSALSWVFQKISEQAQKKKQLDAAQKRELERLRTGRDPGVTVDDPQTSRQRELAARRQAQLEELRRRQQARTGGQAPQGQPPVVFGPGSSGPIVVTPRQQTPPSRPGPRQAPPPFPPARQQQHRPAPRPQAPRPQQQRPPQQRQGPQRPPQQQRPQQRPPQPRQPAQRLLSDSDQQAETGSESHRLLADRPDAAAVRAAEQKARYKARIAADVPKTPADWRRAIIAREILAPPLSQRQPGDDPLLQ